MKNTNINTAGRQYCADVWLDPESIVFKQEEPAKFIADKFVKEINLTVVNSAYYKFPILNEEQKVAGETLLQLLSESHLAVHTYPESNFFSLDIFTCGTKIDPVKAAEVLRNLTDEWKIDHVNQLPLVRGIMPNEVREQIAYKKANPEPIENKTEQLEETPQKTQEEKTEEIADKIIENMEKEGSEFVQLAEPTILEKILDRINRTFEIQAIDTPLVGILFAKGGITAALGKILFLIHFTKK